jgi:hypothetical protein
MEKDKIIVGMLEEERNRCREVLSALSSKTGDPNLEGRDKVLAEMQTYRKRIAYLNKLLSL